MQIITSALEAIQAVIISLQPLTIPVISVIGCLAVIKIIRGLF